MKTLFNIFFLTLLTIANFAQNVGVNSTGVAPDNSAMLDVVSIDKGMLVPRVNILDVNTAAPVTAPAISLLVYNTNATSGVGFYFWDGTKWTSLKDANSNPDEDWYEVGGSLSPDDINDNIFTQGNVGVGLTVPGQKLHISGNYASNSDSYPSSGDVMGGTYLDIQNTFGSSTSPAKVGIRFKTSNLATGQHTKGGIVYQRSTSNGRGDMIFLNNSSDDVSEVTVVNDTKMIIKNNGDIGIATVAPTARLQITSDPIGDNLNDEQDLLLLHTAPTGNNLFLEVKNIRHIAGTDWTGTNTRIQRRVDGTPQAFIDFGIDGQLGSYGLGFGTRDGIGGTQETRMVIDGSGNVGVGTLTPNEHLSIHRERDNSSVTSFKNGQSFVNIYNSSNVNGVSALYRSEIVGDGYHFGSRRIANDNIDFVIAKEHTSSASEDLKLIIKDNGNVGVGTNLPTSKLQVVGIVEYANNAAALAGGLTIGAFYRTGDLLKVVH